MNESHLFFDMKRSHETRALEHLVAGHNHLVVLETKIVEQIRDETRVATRETSNERRRIIVVIVDNHVFGRRGNDRNTMANWLIVMIMMIMMILV